MFKQKKSAAANTGSQRRLKFPARKTIDETKLARYMDRSGSFDLGSSNGLSSNISFGLPSNNPLSRFAIDNEVDENEEEDQTGVEDSDYYEDYGEGTDAEGSGEEDENMNVDLAADDGLPDLGSITNPLSYGSMANGDLVEAGSSIHNETPRGMKRSRGGAVLPYTPPRILRKQRKSRQESVLPSIAKNMASKMGMRRLDEPEDFIVGTEDIIRQELIGAGALIGSHEDSSQLSLPKASERLCDYWRSCRDRDEANAPLLQDAMLGIGPDENALSMHKAAFVAGLLLQLRHPPTAKGKQALAISRLNRSSSKSLFRHTQIPSNPTVYPKVLLDWLEKNHNPYQATVDEVQNYRPSPTAHYNYWDIIFSSTLRGKLALVVRMFKRSNFHHARTAREDGLGSEGYHGIQVSNIENVINRAVQVLELCPGLQDDDWNVTANEWVIFRKRIEQAMEDLTIFAEGQDRDQFRAPTFEAANFGLRSTTMSLSQSSRKAESKVPWTIYQNLKVVYGILLGGTTEILSSAQDWVEGTIGLTVWWDGNGDEGVAVGSLAMTEHSLRQSHSRGAPAVDAEVNSGSLYLGRLAYAFACATDESDDKLFQINPMNAVEVGLASVFEGNISSVMSLLQAWSLPVASAVAELGSIGGWFKTPAVNLMVLDDDVETVLDRPVHQESLMTKDTILTEYAEALSEKGSVRGQRGTSYGGWELAISLLSRLDDQSSGRRSAGKILDRLPLNSDARIDKILETCQRLHMTEEARGITEVG